MTNLVAAETPVRRRDAPQEGPRKDIQALRAIAVGLVVLNHLWPLRLPGGYVGVDVFFVISGFLISKHLLGELERTGRIKLATFYARRIKRLLPAAMLVAVVSLAAAWILLPFSRWQAIAQETMASVFYVENWLLAAKSVDYSAHNDAASTVQHYWSLSVEEQFYLVWPLLLLVLFVLPSKWRLRRRSFMVLGISIVSVAAFLFCIWITFAHRSEAYFVTPARVWEFGAGALLAVAGVRWFPGFSTAVQRSTAGAAQWLGYGLIAYSAFTYNEQTYFPGFAAVVPVLGTLLVIASGPRGPLFSPNTLLAVRPVQFLGDVSYSLYLWHWPLIILAPAVLSRVPNSLDKVAILVLAIVLAYLSKKFVEDPGRSKLFKGARPRTTFIAMVVSMGLVAALGGGMLVGLGQAQQAEAVKIQNMSGQPCYGARSMDLANNCQSPFGAPEVANVGADEAPWFDAPECQPAAVPIEAKGQKLLTSCDFTGGSAPAATVWLVGDSHAEQWKTAVYEMAKANKWALNESLLGGCPFMGAKRTAFMGTPTLDPATQEKCIDWGSQVTARITAEKPDMVFVSSFGAGETIDDGTGRPQSEQYFDGASRAMAAWTAAGTDVFVFRDSPLTLHHSSPDCVALNPAEPLNCANNRAEALQPDPIAEAAVRMNNPKVHVLDFSDQFCDEQKCYAVIGGLHVYFDTDHASRSYINSMVPVITQRFEAARR
ncbi:acyltransferase family protein [Arthrobacter sp. 35W]|uniref:acyltransferase family protein n=1 Tax=Arthrobacter sp. 35W TaxID=1132441 RepID=UPI000403B89F|nr:acyltransferase family protein [Arthrobacter sp. 35W]